MTVQQIIEGRIPLAQLLAWCRRSPVERLWVFGPVLRDWKPESDVDLLVRFLPGREPDLFGRLDLQDELEALIGREVDLVEEDIPNSFADKRIGRSLPGLKSTVPDPLPVITHRSQRTSNRFKNSRKRPTGPA